MIGLLRGKVWNILPDKIVLDVNGVGFLINIPSIYLSDIKVGEEKTFYTHLVVREDDLSLFGFFSYEEKDLFLKMLGVSGIGPKAALSILSMFNTEQIKVAIINDDYSLLTKVPGIGSKTAQRLTLELKGKIREKLTNINDKNFSESVLSSEALETLLALGFSLSEAQEVLNKVIKEKKDLSTEEQVKEALRLLALSYDKK